MSRKRSFEELQKEYNDALRDEQQAREAHEKKLKTIAEEDIREREARGKRLTELLKAMQKVGDEEISEKTKNATDFVWEEVVPPLGPCKWSECKSPGVGHFRIKSTLPECQGSECASSTQVRCEEHKRVFELGVITHVCRKLHKHRWQRSDYASIHGPTYQCDICGVLETRRIGCGIW